MAQSNVFHLISNSIWQWKTTGNINNLSTAGTTNYNYNFTPNTKSYSAFNNLTVNSFDLYYEKLSIEPREIKNILITTEKSYQFLIWNKYVINKQDITINAIENLGVSTEYITPDFLNKTFKPNEYLNFDVVIPKDGNVKFDVTFIFKDTAKGISESINLTGLRAVIIPIIPDKHEEMIKFIVFISKNRKNQEQRRILNDYPYLEIKYDKKYSYSDVDRLLNLLDFAEGKVMVLPIVSEIFEPTSNITGFNEIQINQDLNNYFWIDYFKYVFVFEENNENKYELIEVESYDKTSNKIILKQNVVNTYNKPIISVGDVFVKKSIDVRTQGHNIYNITFEVVNYVD